MIKPKSTDINDIKDFLLYSADTNNIDRWNTWKRTEGRHLQINLDDTNLHDICLQNAHLSNISFKGSNLSNANLSNANLSNANLSNANLSGTDFSKAFLNNANLSSSNLTGSNLSGAILQNTNLRNTNLSGVNFNGTVLEKVNFNGSNYLSEKFSNSRDAVEIELLLSEKEKQIKNLEKRTNKTEDEKQYLKNLLEKETQTLHNQIKKLKAEKNKETKNIQSIIEYLAAMPKEISEEQEYLKTRRKRFTQFGGLFLSLGGLIVLALIINVLWRNKFALPSITNTPQYFAYALAIGFPMAMAFLFYRQANIKSKEIEKINEKSILVQQVENALNSYNVLLSGDELKDKTISSIDRVINKIFDNNHKEEKSEKIEESKLTISDVQKLFKMGSDITK